MTPEQLFNKELKSGGNCLIEMEIDCQFDEVSDPTMQDLFYKNADVLFYYEEADPAVGVQEDICFIGLYCEDIDAYFTASNLHPLIVNYIEDKIINLKIRGGTNAYW